MYSDWNLEEKINKYFFGENPKFLTALDIGANDGVYLSNTRQIILDGWNAVLVDPAESAYKRLVELYDNHPKVLLCNVGIGTESKKEIFYESGSYQKWTDDTALFSTVVESEIKRFPSVSFETKEIDAHVEKNDLIKLKKINTFASIGLAVTGNPLYLMSSLCGIAMVG